MVMGSYSKYKRGQASIGLFEIILVVAVLFIIGVAWVVSNNIGGEIMGDILDSSDFLTTNESRTAVQDLETRTPSFFNGAFALFFIGFFFLGAVSSWYAPTNPVFFVVVFLMIIIVLVVPVLLADSWDEISDDFGGSDIGFMDFVLSNYVLVGVVFTLFTLIIMFVRYKDVG
jgi:hypothetical protein